jgi:capsular exopolysaccharide synthesis family protein
VLLIDADMRRPVIAGLFGITDQPGLSDILIGDKNLVDSSHESVVPGLSIVPNGQATSVPAELLESQRFSLLLKEARRSYDLVLIDAPPLLAVADPAIIAPSVDSVVLTVRVNKNGRRPVENAVRILDDIDVTPAAVIVNGIDGEAKKTYGYGAYSRDHYGYVGHYHNQYAAKDVPSSREPGCRPQSKAARVAG